jgi:hypothetical protein
MAIEGFQTRNQHSPHFLVDEYFSSGVSTLADVAATTQADTPESPPSNTPKQDALLVLLPLLIVLSTFFFLLLLFLVCVLLIRRRRGIILRDNDGPVDMSREELIDGEGGFEGVESRWLESVGEHVRRAYLRAKGLQCGSISTQ